MADFLELHNEQEIAMQRECLGLSKVPKESKETLKDIAVCNFNEHA